MTPSQGLPEKIRKAGISIDDKWQPGDLGLLIHLHGVQNFQDYGFNAMHEAYCAKIAVEFSGIYLWTVTGLDRAIAIYQSVGFVQSAERFVEGWGQRNTEVRFDLAFGSC